MAVPDVDMGKAESRTSEVCTDSWIMSIAMMSCSDYVDKKVEYGGDDKAS